MNKPIDLISMGLVTIIMSIITCVASTPNHNTSKEMTFFFHDYVDEPGGYFQCTATGYPQTITIGRKGWGGFLSQQCRKGTQEVSTLTHQAPDVGCDFMATYVCNATYNTDEVISRYLNVAFKKCVPVIKEASERKTIKIFHYYTIESFSQEYSSNKTSVMSSIGIPWIICITIFQHF
ncbi:unnamed protein product [Lymnaea stagnalis]|uniref:Uncharacterized protein n=1 Tax=Lymnaea stagnalis TaxID=6523 RepID=A0AAV2I1D7_LYMST